MHFAIALIKTSVRNNVHSIYIIMIILSFSIMSLLKKVCNPFESGTSCGYATVFLLFRWFNPIKCMKFVTFVGCEHKSFSKVDLISVDSLN